MGTFSFDQKFGKNRGSESHRNILEKYFENLGTPIDVGLTFGNIGTTGKFRFICPFVLGPICSGHETRVSFAEIPEQFTFKVEAGLPLNSFACNSLQH